VKEIGRKIEENTGRKVELTTKVDPDVLGGLVMRVGNVVMDGSIRARLERLRKQVAKAA
jgi:F-type H+-transporting ATPase subunit delta